MMVLQLSLEKDLHSILFEKNKTPLALLPYEGINCIELASSFRAAIRAWDFSFSPPKAQNVHNVSKFVLKIID